jgi:hypothetical protein
MIHLVLGSRAGLETRRKASKSRVGTAIEFFLATKVNVSAKFAVERKILI